MTPNCQNVCIQGKIPPICTKNGAILRKNIENHLKSKVHTECLKAGKIIENDCKTAPINSKFNTANKGVSQLRWDYTVYNDAKRGTLSAISWSYRVVASDIASKFEYSSEFSIYERSTLHYINPIGRNLLSTRHHNSIFKSFMKTPAV